MKFRIVAAAGLAAVGMVTACSSSPSVDSPSGATRPATSSRADSAAAASAPRPDLRRFYAQRLTWHGCGNHFDCTRLTVPEDYAHPNRATLQLAVIRFRDTADPQASLIVNPGGPGGSGVQFVRQAASAFAPLLSRFALVSFDPRGVGQSHPIRCVTTGFLDNYLNAPPYPANRAQERQSIGLARQFADDCWKRNGSFLGHVGTIDSARDMDVLRAALGDRRLTYYGASYGTFLGAKYAQLFPTRIRAMILDGAVNPAQSTIAGDQQQAVGFETDLHDFLDYCANSGSCPLGGSPVAAYRGLLALEHKVAASPLPVAGRTLGAGNFFNGLASGFYASSDWPQLKTALGDAKQGNGAPLLAFADELSERNDRNNTYSNLLESNISINCIDRPSPRDVAAYRTAATAARRSAPFFGPAIVWSSLPCAFWHVPPVENAHPVHAPGASAPILVMGTTHDPATPYSQAVALTRQLGKARLLTLDGDGHTAFLRFDSCITSAGDAYLIRLRLPPKGTVCH